MQFGATNRNHSAIVMTIHIEQVTAVLCHVQGFQTNPDWLQFGPSCICNLQPVMAIRIDVLERSVSFSFGTSLCSYLNRVMRICDHVVSRSLRYVWFMPNIAQPNLDKIWLINFLANNSWTHTWLKIWQKSMRKMARFSLATKFSAKKQTSIKF